MRNELAFEEYLMQLQATGNADSRQNVWVAAQYGSKSDINRNVSWCS